MHAHLYSNEGNSVQCVKNDFWLCVGANGSSVPRSRVVGSGSKGIDVNSFSVNKCDGQHCIWKMNESATAIFEGSEASCKVIRV